ncbi:MAG: NHLP family bacteriocin export ABC transporter peptidase/permease/ATPase subunit [Gammaproteobacteria bacterium]
MPREQRRPSGFETPARAARPLLRLERRPKRVRVPTVLQMEAVECGAACLGMILSYYGRHVPLEELRAACGVSRDGSKATNILRAARSYGLEARAFRREPHQLPDMELPAVLHWNLNHFVVLEGFGKNRVYLNDPSRGAVSVSLRELDAAFTGVVLTFSPGPDFRAGGTRPALLASLAPRLAGAHAALLYVLIAGFALLIPGMAIPSFSRVFIDSILVRGLHDWLSPLLFLMCATLVVQAGLVWLQHHYLLRLETRLSLRSTAQFFWHVLRLPYNFFVHRYAGEIAQRANISDRVARLLSSELATAELDLVVVLFYVVLMIQYDVLLTLVGVITALINLAALQYTARKRADISQHIQHERGRLMGLAMAGLQSIEMLKASGSESDFFARWSGQLAKLINANQRMALIVLALSPLPAFFLAVNTALVLGIGGLRVMDGELSMGMLLAFQALALAFLTPIGRVLSIGGQLHEVEGGLRRLDDVLQAKLDPNAPRSVDLDERPGSLAKLSGHVELRNITFGFNRLEPPLIQGFSLTLRPGSRVALVGKSGSGKSTVARLVAGLYEPWEGEILFDGKPRSEIPRAVMTASLAMVDQEVFLFEGTLRDNLTMWDPVPTEGDLLDATRDACIYEDIAVRPGGLSCLVEEGGRNFSGGQRQRLEIARALVNRPSILVLDEATSALDPTTEKRIDDNLRRRGCTCLIVAHRLSTIRDCDEIIVMENGQIVQRGTHAEMSRIPGPYRDLIGGE